MILPARLTLELPWPTHAMMGPLLVAKRHSTDSFLCSAKQIARTLADGYVATSQWIQDPLQWDPQLGHGECPRHEIDLLGYVSIPALTQIASVLQSDRTICYWPGDAIFKLCVIRKLRGGAVCILRETREFQAVRN